MPGSLKLTIASVIISAAVVGLRKWSVFYDEETGKLKDFGTSKSETIFPAWMCMILVGYAVYMYTGHCCAGEPVK